MKSMLSAIQHVINIFRSSMFFRNTAANQQMVLKELCVTLLKIHDDFIRMAGSNSAGKLNRRNKYKLHQDLV